jgi:hypothetical protein
MRVRLRVLLCCSGILMSAIGCADAPVTRATSPRRLLPAATPFSDMYPDSAAYIAAGVPFSGDVFPTASGAFISNNTSFRTHATVRFFWATDVSVTVYAEVKNSSGQTINSSELPFAYHRIAVPVAQGDSAWDVTISTSNNTCGLTGKSRTTATASAHETVFTIWELTKTALGDDVLQPQCRLPKPKFAMTTTAQTSGGGGSLTISEGHLVTLQSTTTDFGLPATTADDLVWMMDQAQIGTGASASVVPPYGTHTITLQLANSAGQGEVSATVVVVPSDGAGSCDDPLTDVVETDCDGDGSGTYQYAVGTMVGAGTHHCWELDHYEYDPNTGTDEYMYTTQLYCWDD